MFTEHMFQTMLLNTKEEEILKLLLCKKLTPSVKEIRLTVNISAQSRMVESKQEIPLMANSKS